MIFTRHQSSLFVDAARSAEGVLLLGRLGQGVGLLSDVLASAAAECGRPATCEELHGLNPLRPLSAAAIWLGQNDPSPASDGSDVARYDVIVVLDRTAISTACRLVKPSGRILLLLSSPADSTAARFADTAATHGVLSQTRPIFIRSQSSGSAHSIGYIAGCLSGCLALPERAWRTALAAHLRPRDRRTARSQFAVGRRETSPARSGLR